MLTLYSHLAFIIFLFCLITLGHTEDVPLTVQSEAKDELNDELNQTSQNYQKILTEEEKKIPTEEENVKENDDNN